MTKFKEYLGEKVILQTLELMDEIKKKNPMLQFKVGGNRLYINDPDGANARLELKTSLDVFDTSDADKRVGAIGFDTDGKYWVRSRLIRNEKYGRWNTSQHQSKSSKHMKNIVKEALKALKPLGYEEVKNEYEGSIDRIITARGNQTVAKANSNMRMDFSAIFPELLHMHYTGYTPSTPKMAQAITYAVENREDLEKYYNYNPKKCMVWVRPHSVVYEIGKEIKQVNTVEELPEHLYQKVFVLDITDKGTFVEDVGMKQDTGIYWVLL